jgi:hypothetical protein
MTILTFNRDYNCSRYKFDEEVSLNDLKIQRPYRGADKSLARPTSPCILFDGENISFDASRVIYIYSIYI